ITAHTHLRIHTNNNAHNLHATMTAPQMKTPARERTRAPTNENDRLRTKMTARKRNRAPINEGDWLPMKMAAYEQK
ncbi:hypothetical protein K443DRAFT_114151, partial [Laccaria amethystina LaAM-08-1]